VLLVTLVLAVYLNSMYAARLPVSLRACRWRSCDGNKCVGARTSMQFTVSAALMSVVIDVTAMGCCCHTHVGQVAQLLQGVIWQWKV
jgi:hypothetical protein